MRIALLSDIHGNDIALKAVLKDIDKQGGVDEYWVLGDLVAIGHAPIKVLEILDKLPHTKIIRGNTDRYICTGDRPPPTEEEVIADNRLLPQLVEVERDFSWTQGAVASGGWLPWLSNLPLQMLTKLPDGTAVLCTHASPDKDDGAGIHEQMDTAKIQKSVVDCSADLICVGHTHRPFEINIKGKNIINPGSISNHFDQDVRASYAIIEANEDGYDVKFLRVNYDNEKVVRLLETIQHPAKQFIISHLRGERKH